MRNLKQRIHKFDTPDGQLWRWIQYLGVWGDPTNFVIYEVIEASEYRVLRLHVKKEFGIQLATERQIRKLMEQSRTNELPHELAAGIELSTH